MLGFHPVSGALKSVRVLFSFLLLWSREVLCEVAFVLFLCHFVLIEFE